MKSSTKTLDGYVLGGETVYTSEHHNMGELVELRVGGKVVFKAVCTTVTLRKEPLTREQFIDSKACYGRAKLVAMTTK